MVDMIHATAPNALVAPMASMWATNTDPQSVTEEEAMQMGERTAAFIDAMGGAQADLLVVEWSDRDAGSGLRPWWDDTDQEIAPPHPGDLMGECPLPGGAQAPAAVAGAGRQHVAG